MLRQIAAVVVHQAPEKAPDSNGLQIVVLGHQRFGAQLLVDVLPMQAMRVSIRSAS
jgi:hypothetical protein